MWGWEVLKAQLPAALQPPTPTAFPTCMLCLETVHALALAALASIALTHLTRWKRSSAQQPTALPACLPRSKQTHTCMHSLYSLGVLSRTSRGGSGRRSSPDPRPARARSCAARRARTAGRRTACQCIFPPAGGRGRWPARVIWLGDCKIKNKHWAGSDMQDGAAGWRLASDAPQGALGRLTPAPPQSSPCGSPTHQLGRPPPHPPTHPPSSPLSTWRSTSRAVPPGWPAARQSTRSCRCWARPSRWSARRAPPACRAGRGMRFDRGAYSGQPSGVVGGCTRRQAGPAGGLPLPWRAPAGAASTHACKHGVPRA